MTAKWLWKGSGKTSDLADYCFRSGYNGVIVRQRISGDRD
jgi:hypothetical protein